MWASVDLTSVPYTLTALLLHKGLLLLQQHQQPYLHGTEVVGSPGFQARFVVLNLHEGYKTHRFRNGKATVCRNNNDLHDPHLLSS
jgi:hypothetical protein